MDRAELFSAIVSGVAERWYRDGALGTIRFLEHHLVDVYEYVARLERLARDLSDNLRAVHDRCNSLLGEARDARRDAKGWEEVARLAAGVVRNLKEHV